MNNSMDNLVDNWLLYVLIGLIIYIMVYIVFICVRCFYCSNIQHHNNDDFSGIKLSSVNQIRPYLEENPQIDEYNYITTTDQPNYVYNSQSNSQSNSRN